MCHTVVLALAVACGCTPCWVRPPPEPLPLTDIADAIEANGAGVTSLQGRVGVSVRAPKKKVFLPAEGRLNFARPDKLHLEISKFNELQFSLGTDGRRWWFWSREPLLDEQPNTLWTGSVARIEEAAGHGLVLRPDMVIDALGVGPIRTTRPDVAVLPERYDDAYVLNYVRLAQGRLSLDKKVYLDRMSGRRQRTEYFAPNGARILLATFEGERTEGDLRLVRRVTLEMPLSDAAVRFDLTKLRLNPALVPEAFERPDFPGATERDLDAEGDGPGTAPDARRNPLPSRETGRHGPG